MLQPSDAAFDDYFGYSVSVSENVIATTGNGKIYIFVEPHSGWANATQTATLTASDGTFFQYVAVSGNTVVAAGYDTAAYVFIKPATGWADMTQSAVLTASDGNVFASVAVNGNTIVAGAPSANIGSNEAQGAIYIFVKPLGRWANNTQTAKLTASDGVTDDVLGFSVAISGNTVVAGAPDVSDGPGTASAYVFIEPTGGWTDASETGKLSTSGGASLNSLGWSTAINGSTIVVGAPSEDNATGVIAGAAFVYVRPANGWTNAQETAQLSPSNGVDFGAMGSSVAVSEKLVLAGSPGTIDYSLRQAVYEFVKPAGGWQMATQTAAIGPPASTYAEFGNSVSSFGSTIVVGAPGSAYTTYQGLVYVYGPSQRSLEDSE